MTVYKNAHRWRPALPPGSLKRLRQDAAARSPGESSGLLLPEHSFHSQGPLQKRALLFRHRRHSDTDECFTGGADGAAAAHPRHEQTIAATSDATAASVHRGVQHGRAPRTDWSAAAAGCMAAAWGTSRRSRCAYPS
eukprot:2082105-Prymnesium_polylepis.1